MPAQSKRNQITQILAQTEETSTCLQVEIVIVGDDGHTIVERLGRFGGLWDRDAQDFTGPAPRQKLIRVHKGQAKAMRWFVAWLRAYIAWRKEVDVHGIRNAPELRLRVSELVDLVVRFVLLFGGRRGGKTVIGVDWLLIFAIAIPGSIVWAIAPSEPRAEELVRELDDLVPEEFIYDRAISTQTWRLWNDSVIMMVSGWDGKSLKRGRCDLALLNEAQEMSRKGYLNVRGATADRGSMLILAANPPDTAGGAYVDEIAEAIEAGAEPAVKFTLTARDNPFVDWGALEALRSQMTPDEAARELDGESRPRSDIAWPDFRQANVQRPGELFLGLDGNPVGQASTNARRVKLEDITVAFLRRWLGVPEEVTDLVVMDFQLKPYMAATQRRIYAPYWDGAGDREALDWTVAEWATKGDEHALVAALEASGLTGATTACIIDASGEFQRADRKEMRRVGGTSAEMLRQAGWPWIFLPDPKLKDNPNRLESFKHSGARLHAADGRRRSYVAPECVMTIRALKNHPNQNGAPAKFSEFGHFSDTFRYLHWRLWPRLETPPATPRFDVVDIHPRQTDEW